VVITKCVSQIGTKRITCGRTYEEYEEATGIESTERGTKNVCRARSIAKMDQTPDSDNASKGTQNRQYNPCETIQNGAVTHLRKEQSKRDRNLDEVKVNDSFRVSLSC
jgi:hypothetical protein